MTRWNNSYESVLRCALEVSGAEALQVNEGAQATPGGRKIKNFDLMVWRKRGAHWLLEIKGRKLGRSATPNAWATMEDVASLEGWRDHFGAAFEPVLGFVFELGARGEGRRVMDAVGAPEFHADVDAEFGESASPWFGGMDKVAADAFGDFGRASHGMLGGQQLPTTMPLAAVCERDQRAVLAADDPRLPHFHMHGRAWQAWLVTLQDFQSHAKLRSAKWKTLMLSVASFRKLARPMLECV